jgi:hypothetical protein
VPLLRYLLRNPLWHSSTPTIAVDAAITLCGHTTLPPAVCPAPAPASDTVILASIAVTAAASCTCLWPILWRQLEQDLWQRAATNRSSSSTSLLTHLSRLIV